MKTVSRPEPNSTPERAMDLLIEKVRLVHGEQDWSSWEWSAREYATQQPHVIPFSWGVRLAHTTSGRRTDPCGRALQ
jgi:hypothetical protein